MADYFSRLVSRNAASPGKANLKPYIRSRSPIADLDQRVGMPGFDGVVAQQTNLSDTESELQSFSETSLTMPSTNVTPVSGQIQRKEMTASTSSAISANAKPASSTTNEQEPTKLSSTNTRPKADNLIRSVVNSESNLDSTIMTATTPVLGLSEAIPNSPNRQTTSSLETVEHHDTVSTDNTTLQDPFSTTIDDATSDHAITVDTQPLKSLGDIPKHRLQSSLNEVADGSQSEFFANEDLADTPSIGPVSEQGSSFTATDILNQVLGQLNAEPRTEQQKPITKEHKPATPITHNRVNSNEAQPPVTTTSATSKPATAESVSLIGSLRQHRNSNLRFALKQR